LRIRSCGVRVNPFTDRGEGDRMSDVEDHWADYSGLHAFLFIDHVEPGKTAEEVVAALRAKGRPPIMYASTFVGDYVAFAHVRVETLGELQDLIEGTVWEAGARCSWSVESPIAALGAKRKSPGLIALTRIKMQPRFIDQAREALVEANSTGFVGASVITGQHDILLQMTGTTIEDVKANIQNAVSSIEGVVRTSTAFADGNRTESRYGEIPLND
jgi:DNA-binding Lrp family transcriptional regulator